MNSWNKSEFKQKLDQNHTWPDNYMFKFLEDEISIVPFQQTQKVLDLFEKRDTIATRESKNSKYVCVTAEISSSSEISSSRKHAVKSSKEVLDMYEKASYIKGVFPL